MTKIQKLKIFCKWIVGVLIVVAVLAFFLVDFLSGSSVYRSIRNIFYIPETRYVSVEIRGDVFGYPINIKETKVCKSALPSGSWYSTGFDKGWILKNPYMYQINNIDNSVTVIEVGDACMETPKGEVRKIYWFSSNEKPEQIKVLTHMNNDKEFRDNTSLQIRIGKARAESKGDIRFNWKTSDCKKNNVKSSSSFLYTNDVVRVIDKEAWESVSYLRENINKNASKPYQLIVPKNEIKNLNRVYSSNYSLVKNSGDEFVLDLSMGIGGLTIVDFDKVINTPFKKCKRFSSSFNKNTLFKVNDETILFSEIDIKESTKMTGLDKDGFSFIYFPKNKIIVQFYDLTPNSYLYPALPVIEEIK